MAYKEFLIDEIGQIKIYKNRKNKSLKLSLSNDGSIRLSMPIWVTYKMGIQFIRKNKEWVNSNKRKNLTIINDQQNIGKDHRIIFVGNESDKIRTSVKENYVTIFHPLHKKPADDDVQLAAFKASKKALKKESEKYIVVRASQLANENNFDFSNIHVKPLKGRWGSCNQLKELTFNIYLIQLPWNLIDYVIYHELVHTMHMNHGDEFWSELSKYVHKPKNLRKEMKIFAPTIITTE